MYRDLESVLENMNQATLLGKPGDGKSTTAAHLLLKYRKKGFTPLFLSSLQDARIVISTLNSVCESDRRVVAIDNAFGSLILDSSKIGEWIALIERMEKIVREKDGDLLVIFTSRRHIFIDIKSVVAKFRPFFQSSIIDMTDSSHKYSAEDKKAILAIYLKEYNIKDCVSAGIENVEPPLGFPYCVELFCTNAFLREKGLSFFENPAKFIQDEIVNFQLFDRAKFLVLLLILIKENNMTRACLENYS